MPTHTTHLLSQAAFTLIILLNTFKQLYNSHSCIFVKKYTAFFFLCILTVYRQTSEEDFAFVEDPDEDFLCPVTMGLLLQPHLTTCCGKHLSQEAAKQIKKEGKACPLCKSTEWSTVMNHHFRRRVSEVKVFCHDPECDWQGPLSELERHMQHTHHSSSGKTLYTSFLR